MSKEKQIKEMVRLIETTCSERISEAGESILRCPFSYGCDECTAVALYNAGYRKSSEGEWSRFEVNSSKGYGQVYYQHKDCDFNATQLFPSPYHYCPNCGAKMKGGGE